MAASLFSGRQVFSLWVIYSPVPALRDSNNTKLLHQCHRASHVTLDARAPQAHNCRRRPQECSDCEFNTQRCPPVPPGIPSRCFVALFARRNHSVSRFSNSSHGGFRHRGRCTSGFVSSRGPRSAFPTAVPWHRWQRLHSLCWFEQHRGSQHPVVQNR